MEQKPPRGPMQFYKRHKETSSLEGLTPNQKIAYGEMGRISYDIKDGKLEVIIKPNVRTEITKGEIVLDKEGLPVIEVRVPKAHEITQLPERYIGYDKSDQIIAQQFVDDERNFEIRAKLDTLLGVAQGKTFTDKKTGEKRKGTKNDIPMEKLAEVLKEYGIRSSFVAVLRRTRGKAREVYVDADIMTKGRVAVDEEGREVIQDTVSLEGWVPSEEKNVEGWFQASSSNVADEFVMLGEISNLYFELLKKFAGPEVTPFRRAQETEEETKIRLAEVSKQLENAKAMAWQTAYNQTIERIKDDTRILRAQLEPLIREELPEITDKDLTKRLKEENAIFALRLEAIDKIINTEYEPDPTTGEKQTGRDWLTNPENVGKSIPFGKPATPGQVYDSIRSSASKGERALQAVGYSEPILHFPTGAKSHNSRC